MSIRCVSTASTLAQTPSSLTWASAVAPSWASCFVLVPCPPFSVHSLPRAREDFLKQTGSYHSSAHTLPLSPTVFIINSKILLVTHRALDWSSPCPPSSPHIKPFSILPLTLCIATLLTLSRSLKVLCYHRALAYAFPTLPESSSPLLLFPWSAPSHLPSLSSKVISSKRPL